MIQQQQQLLLPLLPLLILIIMILMLFVVIITYHIDIDSCVLLRLVPFEYFDNVLNYV